MRQIFIITILFFLLSTFAKSQDVPSYLFLEVIDSDQKPVAGAKVDSDQRSFKYTKEVLKTDEKGAARFYLFGNYYENPAKSLFAISKEGFFTFHDLGLMIRSTGYERQNTKAQIELLKTPQIGEEKKILSEQSKREFMWAAKTGDSQTVRKMLKTGISPNLNTYDLRGIPGPGNVPAILLAAHSADGETVKALIEAGANIRSKDEPLRSLLVNYLSADPFYLHKFKTDEEREEILRGYEEGAEILLKAGADFEAENERFGKPIFIAAYKGYARTLKLMLDKGLSPNDKGKYGNTLLVAAVWSESENARSKIETVKLLLDKGADPNAVDEYGCNPILYTAASTGDAAVIKALLDKGAKVNSSCSYRLPLVAAIRYGKVEAVKLLVEPGIRTGEDGRNALMLASGAGNLELVRMLLNMNFRITDRDNEGRTALMFAALSGNLEIAKILLEKGFRVDDKDNEGKTALFYAISDSKIETMKFLLKAGANPNTVSGKNCITPLMETTYSPNALKFLVENGAKVNFACADGTTALSSAVKILDFKVIEALIELGANPNGKAMDKSIEYIRATFNEDRDKPRRDEVIKMIEEARRKNQNN